MYLDDDVVVKKINTLLLIFLTFSLTICKTGMCAVNAIFSKPQRSGVSQGSILGPLLFVLMTNGFAINVMYVVTVF